MDRGPRRRCCSTHEPLPRTAGDGPAQSNVVVGRGGERPHSARNPASAGMNLYPAHVLNGRVELPRSSGERPAARPTNAGQPGPSPSRRGRTDDRLLGTTDRTDGLAAKAGTNDATRAASERRDAPPRTRIQKGGGEGLQHRGLRPTTDGPAAAGKCSGLETNQHDQ